MIGPRPPVILSEEFKGIYAKRGRPSVLSEACPSCGKKLSYFMGTHNTDGVYRDFYCVCMRCGGNFRYYDGGDGGTWYKIGDTARGVEVPGDA